MEICQEIIKQKLFLPRKEKGFGAEHNPGITEAQKKMRDGRRCRGTTKRQNANRHFKNRKK